jgi:RNA polymerase sigma-70 factor (ECF subfamily)
MSEAHDDEAADRAADRAANDAMDRYASGDDLAFEAVYDAVAPRVLALAFRSLGDRTLAEDVVQQTLLNIHRARGAFVPGSPLMPWAYAIARRLIVDAVRRRRRELRLVEREGLPGRQRRNPTMPNEALMAYETAGSLRATFAALPGSQQAVLHLRGEGLPLSTMASTLGTTVTAVKLRLHRAMSSLKRSLASSGRSAGHE